MTLLSDFAVRQDSTLGVNPLPLPIGMDAELVEMLTPLAWRATDYISPHEYIVSTWKDGEYAQPWLIMRGVLARHGFDMPWRDRRPWRYLNLSDGWRYWVMRENIYLPFEFRPEADYVLNRRRQDLDDEFTKKG